MSGVLLGCVLSFAAAAPAGGADDFGWTASFSDLSSWTRQPGWLSNPSPDASLAAEGPAACFRVDQPGRGMKWSLSPPEIALGELPYAVVRYRAENLDTRSNDYFLFLDDRVPGRQLAALRLSDMKADGKWHVAAVDVTTLTSAQAIHAVAVQVQANRQGRARVWLDRLQFTDAPPEGAEWIGRPAVVEPRPDWIAPLARAQWTAQSSWLANPASGAACSVERKEQAALFRTTVPGRGMKWSWNLPEPVSLQGHRYLSMRYRATGCSPHGDYALCVLGKPRSQGVGYLTAIPPDAVCNDGRWHRVEMDLRTLAAELSLVSGLAIQVQAAAPNATLEVADIRLTDQRQPSKVADAVDWSAQAAWEGFRPIALHAAAQTGSRAWRRHLRLEDWFRGTAVTVQGIPFQLLDESREHDLATTSLRGKSELRFPVGAAAKEVYLLALAAFQGTEEPAFGNGRLISLRDVDRFRVRLQYADGTQDECLPLSAATKAFGVTEGLQVLVAAADDSRQLEAVVVCDSCKQAAFAVAALTVRTGAPLFPETLEDAPPLRVKHAAGDSGRGTTFLLSSAWDKDRAEQGNVAIAEKTSASSSRLNALPKGEESGDLPVLRQLVHRAGKWNLLTAPSPLVKLQVDDKQIPLDDLQPLHAEDGKPAGFRWYAVRAIEGLRLGVSLKREEPDGLKVEARVENRSGQTHRVVLVAPWVGPYRLSERADDTYYLLPKRGAALDNTPCSYRERYCGLFPLQFVDTFSAADGRGLSLRTLDTDCLWKHYLLEKKDGLLTAGVEYLATLGPGNTLPAAPAVIAVTDGDWHRGLDAYRQWLAGWHRPLSPRKPWFREVFNFRQRFLWGMDPLYDAKTGELHLQRAVDEARREFGGIDYLHLFDWGNCGPYGRIYGRTGDYSPYDYLRGGREMLRKAIAGVQAQGVPVGLYIEAYLLEERGKLGKEFGKEWQLLQSDRKGLYWPQSTEMYACSFVPAWREVQASTYAAKVRELDVDGMYMDEYGFAGSGVDCWSAAHGHAAPGYAVVGERDCTRLVRRRVDEAKRGVALYSEESPVDVTTQYQDGSFTYSMSSARQTQTRAPLNLTRFAIPDFKTIEILYCDKPTGSWATGVKWVFFNGEAIWLEGEAVEWFEPHTREAIRRCYRILHKHRDAMTTLAPVPLVPTGAGGVFCNAFPAQGKTVYTFYNARHRTFRGDVLRLANAAQATCYDEWHERPATVRRDGADAVIHLEIAPHDVGCVVVK